MSADMVVLPGLSANRELKSLTYFIVRFRARVSVSPKAQSFEPEPVIVAVIDIFTVVSDDQSDKLKIRETEQR